ncbi:MAG: hypothetical protein KAX38_02275 [Candidatus Krumholzibacteria bacterium]|nr:hypothetical protein [Candidatus Krumholzibacteria bacterium]
MAIRCPKCGREFDVTLFEYEREVHCPCGEVVSLKDGHRIEGDFDWDAFEREIFEAVDSGTRIDSRRETDTFKRDADRIASLILHSDMPWIDIEIEIRAFRGRVLEKFPDKGELFDAIYLGRFRRLWEQFRVGGDSLFDNHG